MSLDIWLHGVHTARATPKSGGRKVVIEYTDEGRLGYGPDRRQIWVLSMGRS